MKSVGISQEGTENSHTRDTTFYPELNDWLTRFGRVKFKGICLRQDSVSFLHKNIVNLYILYKLDTCSKDVNPDFNCLFGAVNLTKNADADKYRYSGYGIGLDSRSQFSWLDWRDGKNFIIFGVHNGSSVHTDDRNKNILVHCERLTQGLDKTAITAETKY